jgi:hypothetical protein
MNWVKEWVRNGLGIKILMHIIGFWVFIIFHECVHRWGKHSPLDIIKLINVYVNEILFFIMGPTFL